MNTRFAALGLMFALLTGIAGQTAHAQQFTIEPAHAGVTFKISHVGLSWTYGRFNDVSGTFTIDPDPAKVAFNLTIKAESIDTANAKRDEHLRSPDFFNVKQFPGITFKSTAVKAIKDGYEVTGDFTLHGVTKSITFNLIGGRTAEFPKGVTRTGFSTDLTIKRADYGFDKFDESLGKEVHISVSFEGVKK